MEVASATLVVDLTTIREVDRDPAGVVQPSLHAADGGERKLRVCDARAHGLKHALRAVHAVCDESVRDQDILSADIDLHGHLLQAG